MGEHIERMKVELKELNEKIEKLSVFLDKEYENPTLTDIYQRTLLDRQLDSMEEYSAILEGRIKYDTEKNEVKNDK